MPYFFKHFVRPFRAAGTLLDVTRAAFYAVRAGGARLMTEPAPPPRRAQIGCFGTDSVRAVSTSLQAPLPLPPEEIPRPHSNRSPAYFSCSFPLTPAPPIPTNLPCLTIRNNVYSTIRIYRDIPVALLEAMMLDSMRQFKAGIFQALAHPTRVAIIECLQQGEMSVSGLCEKLSVEQANASQHLAVLRNKHLVETRKEGNQIFYRIRDPLLGDVLEKMREYFFAHLTEAMQMLEEEQREAGESNQGPQT